MRLNFLYQKTPNLSFLDIYSLSGNLKIQGKDKYSYVLSVILSILSIITIFVISAYFVVTVFQRRSLSVIFNLDSMETPVVNLTEYPMTFHLYDSYGTSLKDQDKIYYIIGKFRKYAVELDENNEPKVTNKILDIKLEKCDLEKHFGNYKKSFSKIADLHLKYCLPANSHNITLYGKFGNLSEGFSFLHFFIQKCIKGQDGKEDCFEESEINNFLSTVHLEFMRLDYDINHNIPQDPKVLTLKADTYQLTSYIFRKINKYISDVRYSTDYGLIFESIDTIKFFQDERHEIEHDFRKQGIISGSFSSLLIMNYPKIHNYNRLYFKLQTLLANIGGIIQGVTVIVKTISFLFARKLTNFVIFQSLFEILTLPDKKCTRENFDKIIFKDVKSEIIKKSNINKSVNSESSYNFDNINRMNSKTTIIR